MTNKLATLNDGLLESLRDIYSAELQLIKALPKLEDKASNSTLKKALHAHFLETEGQIERLDEIGRLLKQSLSGKTCKAMQGLIEEGKEVLEQESDNKALLDALLIGAAVRVEHYEMAAYDSATSMAKELGLEKVVALLEQSIAEEVGAEKKLSAIAVEEVLSQANLSSELDEEDGDPKPTAMHKSRNPKKPGNSARVLGFVAALILCDSLGSLALAAPAPTTTFKNDSEAANYQGDNTGKNVRDRDDSRVTADDQRLGGTNLEVLARIRREIVANDKLSTNGHNVKIVVENGKVTLRGPVKSQAERTWIQETTKRTASGYRVDNQLEVTPG